VLLKLQLQLKLKQTPRPGTGNCAGLFLGNREEQARRHPIIEQLLLLVTAQHAAPEAKVIQQNLCHQGIQPKAQEDPAQRNAAPKNDKRLLMETLICYVHRPTRFTWRTRFFSYEPVRCRVDLIEVKNREGHRSEI
jgi:hypothetical protein